MFLLLSYTVFATHNRAGEITYEHISGYTYTITLLTYTYTPSAANEDRDVLLIDWGDDTYSEIPRIDIDFLPDDYQKNMYTGTHQYPGPGNYFIVMEDKNRNQGIDNIVESVYIPFTIKTKLSIAAVGEANSTPLLLNPPIDKAVVGQLFVHNPTAYDPDGDSLSYALTVCSGSGGEPIESYTFPVASKTFYVDSITGDLVWDAPVKAGRFNVAMVISEYRDGVQISAIVRDIQIDVEEADNHPPVIDPLEPICVVAGETVSFPVSASDPDGDSVALSAVGGPFEVGNSPALFPVAIGQSNVQSQFEWPTTCSHIRKQPYTVLFKATDFASVPLTAQLPVDITVIGHPQEIEQVEALYDEVRLALNAPVCSGGKRLLIYRAAHSSTLSDDCIPEVSDDYELIADTTVGLSEFVDDDQGKGLSQGYKYCYRTVIVFPDGAKSYPSAEVCASLETHAPLLTNVSVLSQQNDTNLVMVKWTKPLGLDLAVYPEPYSIDLLRSNCNDVSVTELVANFSDFNDTMLVDTIVASDFVTTCYQLQWNVTVADALQPVGRPVSASSIQLSTVGKDEVVELSMSASVPWENERFYVFRSQNSGDNWEQIGETDRGFFADSSVSNGMSYCYYVESVGGYGLDGFPTNLHNLSPKSCTIPVDSFPPAETTVSVQQDCNAFANIIEWEYGDDSADIDSAFVYYKACELDVEYHLIASLNGIEHSYVHRFVDSLETMGGCYMVLSADDAGNVSDTSNQMCVNSCPSYVLPNVFTPDGDGLNDYWQPIENKFVQSIEMSVYNIWGDLVFSTQDPEINWSGQNTNTNETLPDGMFYYICQVNELWLNCEVSSRSIVGFVHKFSNGQKIPVYEK